MKIKYGCEKDIAPEKFFGETITRCPLRAVLDDPELLSETFRHFNWLEKGFLPSAGTWYDQTEYFIAMMDAVKTARNEVDNWQMEQSRKKGNG